MDIKKIAASLKRLSIADRRKMAKKTGVAYTTINNIAYGYTTNPRLESAAALHKAIK